MNSANQKTLLWIQFGFDIAVVAGFLFSILPILATLSFFGGFLAVFWMLPLTIVSLVLSIITKNSSLPYTITNTVISVLLWIPIISFILPIAGIILAIASITTVYSAINKKDQSKQHATVEAESAKVVEK